MKQKQTPKLIILSAMYENGGNTTQRFLDGHPQLNTYPFESQLGTKYINDFLSGLYPTKYRWPVFPNHFTPAEIYESISDEEVKVQSKTPFVSKFRDWPFEFNDSERKNLFIKTLNNQALTRPNIVLTYFESTFKAWKNRHQSGREEYHLGYSPIIAVDADKIINDYQGQACVIHVVRNPFSAYADTKKRPVPLSLAHYLTGWITCQYFAKIYEQQFPQNFFIVRYEDIVENPAQTLGKVLYKLKLKPSETLTYPSWNGEKLTQVYPWGTIRTATPAVNLQTAQALTKMEIKEIFERSQIYLQVYNYLKFYQQLK